MSQATDFLLDATKGNASAHEFLVLVFHIHQIWDDLHDGDVVVSKERLGDAFDFALFGLPCNAFYSQNFEELHPILVNVIRNWRVSNGMRKICPERGWTIRCSYFDLIAAVATICGGRDHGIAIGIEVHAASARDDTLADYLKKWGG